jgi:hypothetical protein
MRKKPARFRALLLLPFAAALFLVGWVISYFGSNKAQRGRKQRFVKNNKVQLGVLLPEHELKQPENKAKAK